MYKRPRILPSRMPLPQNVDPAEREYVRNIIRYQRTFNNLMLKGLGELIPDWKEEASDDMPATLRQDSAAIAPSQPHFDANIPRKIDKLFARIQKQLQNQIPDRVLKKWAQAMVTHVNDINKKNMIKAAKAVDLDIEPFLKDGQLNPFFQNIVDENVSLIKSISTRQLPAVKNYLVAMITADKSQAEIHDYIHKRFSPKPLSQGSPYAQARLIARDQVNKLNGKINQYRQTKLGVTKYIWATSKDERVRGNPSGLYPDAKPSHWAREGDEFSWDKPPKGGHPGIAINCRCSAIAILDDIVD